MAKTDAATRRTGAHFLAPGSRTVQRLVEAARLQAHETVLDAGAGEGAITEALAAAVPDGKVLAVETDPRRAGGLRAREWPNVEVLEEDALKATLPPIDAVVANPPYRIIPALLRRLLDVGFKRAVLVVPQELAERLTAQPKTASYGKLTIQVGLRAKTKLVHSVPRRDFSPPPAVPSAMIEVTPKAVSLDLSLLDVVLDAAWEGRKRTLRHALAPVAAELDVPPQDVSSTLDGCKMRDRTFFEVAPWEFGNFSSLLAATAAARRAEAEG